MKPEIIVCDISGYGADGPYRDKKAYDLLIQSEAGFLSVTGTPDEPSKAGPSIADIAAGMYAYTNILAALLQRAQTGEGQHIDVSMLESLAEWTSYPLYYAFDGAPPPPRTGAAHATIYPYGPFPTGDGGTVMLGLQNEREWVSFCEIVLQRPELATDPRFAGNASRVAERDALRQIIVDAFAALTAAAGARAAGGGADRQRPGQHHARRVGAPAAEPPAAAGARSARRPARCPRCCRRAPGTSSRGWTRCPRSASTPTRPGRAGLRRAGDPRAARRRGRSEMAAPRTYLFVPGNRRNASPRRWPAGPTRSCSTWRTRSPRTPRPTRAPPSRAWAATADPSDRARAVVRINDAGVGGARRRTCGWSPKPGCTAVMLPKAETAEQVRRGARRSARVQVLALIETARGVEQCERDRRGRRGDPAGVRHARLRARPRPGHRATHRTGWATPRAGWPSHPASPGCPRRSPASRPSWTTEARLLADLAWSRRHGFGAKLCIHPAQVEPIHTALAPDAEAVDVGAPRARGRPRGTRSRPARRPHDRPPGGPAGRAAPWPARGY